MRPLGSRRSKACTCCNRDKSSRGRETNEVRSVVRGELDTLEQHRDWDWYWAHFDECDCMRCRCLQRSIDALLARDLFCDVQPLTVSVASMIDKVAA